MRPQPNWKVLWVFYPILNSMLDWIFGIIIILCLGGAIFIISRKLPELSALDVHTLPEEKSGKKKKEIIGKRIDARRQKIKENSKKYLTPFRRQWGQWQLKFRIYVGKIERLMLHEQAAGKKTEIKIMDLETEARLKKLVDEGGQYLTQNNLERAEEKFIAAIKLDTHAASAYRGLADTYFAKKSLEEARATYQFVLQLDKEDDSVMVKLAEIAESQGDLEEAIEYYQQAVVINDSLSPRFVHLAELLLRVGQPLVAREAIEAAVELEPQNPKYLDLLTETAILCQDKTLALKVYSTLCLVNPENKKLPDLKQRIDLL